jgi:hypothetical protein
MRQIFLTGKKSQKWSALLRAMVAYRASQHRIASLERVEGSAQGDGTLDVECHFAADVRQGAQVLGE